jgi:hypothetical protein
MNTGVAVGGTVYGWVSTDLDTANKYSIPLITYEGGQGLSYFAGRFSVEMSAQFDPGMFTVYNNNFAMCTAINAATLPYLHLGTAGFYGNGGYWPALINLHDVVRKSGMGS